MKSNWCRPGIGCVFAVILAATLSWSQESYPTRRGYAVQASKSVDSPMQRRGANAAAPLLQRISIQVVQLPLEEVLREVAARGNVRISYSNNVVPVQRRVSMNLPETTVGEALLAALQGTNVEFSVRSSGQIALVQRERMEQETGSIIGKVSDARTGMPLLGANVFIQGTTLGAASDSEGDYLIERVPPGNYTLQVRFLGYRRATKEVRIVVGEQSKNDFALEQTALDMDEVVVTGTSAVAAKREQGSSISTVGARDLEFVAASSIDRALSGKFSGALIQQNSGNPGGGVTVILRGSHSVLGDVTPLYIIDGVIVNNDATQIIDIGGDTQNRLVDINMNDIDRIEIVKGAAAAALYGSRANNGVIQMFTKQGVYGEQPRITFATSIGMDVVRRTLEVNTYPFDADGNPVNRYDWQDYIFRDALGTQQNLSISGGVARTRYFVSGSYLNNQGVVRGSSFERYGARAKVDQDLGTWATLTVGANYSLSRSQDIPNGGLGSDYGCLTSFLYGPNSIDPRPDPTTGQYPGAAEGVNQNNPVETIDKFNFRQWTDRFIGNANLTVFLLPGLSVESILGYDTYTGNGISFIPIGTNTIGVANGSSRRVVREVRQMNWDVNVRYQTQLHELVKSTTLLGSTYQTQNVSSLTGSSTVLSPIAQLVTAGSTQSMGEFRSDLLIVGFFVQQTLGIDNRYFLTAAGRVDASSVFGENDRWQFYPKATGSYLLSEEAFWKNLGLTEYVPTFKLRASFGYGGGLTAIGSYERYTTFSPVSWSNLPGLNPTTQLGAVDIKPERQREIEVGTDLSLFNDRLGIEFSYYTQHTTDLLLQRTTAPTSGYLRQLQNVGTLDNEGVELLVRGVLAQYRDFRWTSTLIYSANRNKVDDIEGGRLYVPNGWNVAAAMNGQPLGVFYGRAYEREADGSIKVVDGIPQMAVATKIIGDPNPDFTASLINEFEIAARWTARIQLDAIYGNDVLNWTNRVGNASNYGVLKGYEAELRGEVPKGYNDAMYKIFEHFVEDGSFLKVRELALSYSFKPGTLGFRSMRISLIGRNLLSIDNYSGYDPEVNIGGSRTGIRSFDFAEVPIPSSFVFSLNFAW